MNEEQICPKCGHDIYHHENYSNGISGTLIGECFEENCNCGHHKELK